MNPERAGGGGRRIFGVVVGIVSNITDPDKMGRVKVKFPWMGQDVESHWARVTGQYAGNSRGFMHIPELGDQVMVGFDDGDPTHPYVMGAVYNGQHTVPGPGNPDGKNDHKYFRSRAGHDFEFLDTDGAEKIRLVDSSTNNSMVFDTAADTITTQAKTGSIRIRAPKGLVKMECVDLKITTTEGRKADVGTTHTVSVGTNRTVGVSSGNLVQSAGNSLTITTATLEATTKTGVTSSAGSLTMNQGSMEVDVADVAHTQQGPATRTIGSLKVKATDYTTEGTDGPTGALTMMAGMLKGQIDSGGGAFHASGVATVMAGLINVKSSSMTIAGSIGEGGAQPAALSTWLGGLLLLNPKMLTFPSVKMLDPIMGLDNHTTLPSITVPPLPPLVFFPTPFMGPVVTGIKPMVLVNFRPSAIANCVALSFHMPPLPWPWPPIPWGALLKQLVLMLIQIPFSILLNGVKAGLQAMAAQSVPALRSGFVGDFLGTTYAQPPKEGESPFQFGRVAATYADPNVIASMLSALLPLPVAHASVTFGSSSVTSCGAPMGMAMPMGAASCTEPVPRPNAMATTFSNVLVGISLGDLLGQIAWNKFENKANAMYMKGVNKAARGAGHLVKLSGIKSLQNVAQKINDFMGGKNCIAEGHPVDVVSGTLFTEAVDFTLYSAQEVPFRRFYNSRTETIPFDGDDMGPGWYHSLDHILVADETIDDLRTLTLRDDEGRVIGFEHPLSDGETAFNAFERLTLTRVDGRTYEIRDLDHRVRVFRFPGREGKQTGATYMPGVKNVARLQAIIEPMGGAGVRPRWDRAGRLQGFTDPAGREVICKHDPQGHITELRLVSSGGQACDIFLAAYEYTVEGRLRTHIDRNRNKRRYAYDANGRMVKETDRNGYSFHFHHDQEGRCVRTYGDDNSFWVELEYIANGSTTLATDAMGGITRYVFDPEIFKVTEIEDAEGGIAKMSYTDEGWLETDVDQVGGTTEYSYDGRGLITEVIDPNGNPTTYTYDAEHHLERISDVSGRESEFLRDGRGLVVEATTPAGRRWRALRDQHGRPVATLVADDERQLYEWSERGILKSETNPHGIRRRYRYNAVGLLTESIEIGTDGSTLTTRIRRDAEGRTTAVDRPGGRSERFELSPEGQLTRISVGARTSRRRYAGWGRLVEHVDPLGRSTRIEHDAYHQVLAINLPGDRKWSYERDAVGRVTRMQTPYGVEIRYTLDAVGRPVAEHRPSREIRRTYDARGQVVHVDWGHGVETRTEYDSSGRMIRIESTDDVPVSRAYDADGLALWDAVGDSVVRYGHDSAGRRSKRSTNWGVNETLVHDGPRLTALYDGHGQRHTFETDGFGRRHQWIRPGGTRQTWERDDFGRVRTSSLFDLDGHALWQSRLFWGEDDVIEAIEYTTPQHTQRENYAYDAGGRLRGWSPDGREQLSITLDEADNLIADSSVDDRTFDRDRLIADSNGGRYRYDEDARLIAIERASGTERFWFDARDRLVRVQTADDGLIHHRYDAIGRRIETVSESSRGDLTTEHFAYDGDALARRTVFEGSTDRPIRDETYTYAPDTDRPLFRLVRSDNAPDAEVQYYTTDARGAAVRLTSADGTMLWEGQADPYGRYSERGPETGHQPIRLAGQIADTASGLCHHRFRVYDPRDARFISPDPLGLPGGDNAFGYPTDPVRFADPSGLTRCTSDADGAQRPGRRGALNAAKQDLGIPRSQHPDAVNHVPMTDMNGKAILGPDGRRIITREYTYTRPDGSPVIIQDHSAGHQFGEGGVGDQGPHFNVRPPENTRTGKVPGTQPHYEFDP